MLRLYHIAHWLVHSPLLWLRKRSIQQCINGSDVMLDNVMMLKWQQANTSVIGWCTLEIFPNKSSGPIDSSVKKMGSLHLWVQSFVVRCSVQLLFVDDKLVEISLAALDCFWHCRGSFQECSCSSIITCEMRHQHFLESKTRSPHKKEFLCYY